MCDILKSAALGMLTLIKTEVNNTFKLSDFFLTNIITNNQNQHILFVFD